MESKKPQAASLIDPPKEGQLVEHNGEVLTTVREGRGHILVPRGIPTSQDPKATKDENAPVQQVFYNPIQQFNRDLSVLAIRVFGEDTIARRTLQKAKVKQRQQAKRKAKAEAKAGKDETEEPVAKKARLDRGPSEANGVAMHDSTARASGADTSAPHADGESAAQDEIADEEMIAIEQSLTQPPASAPEAAKGENSQREPAPQEPRPTVPRYKTINILDALSATGLRAVRYAQELPFETRINANDLSSKAVQAIQMNIKHNRLEDQVRTTTSNAIAHMYQFTGQEAIGGPGVKYDVIDLDPYGTAAPFLDAAVQALSDGGLLCATFTDSGVFASHGYPEKTYAMYGGTPINGTHSHEGGLRLVLHAIATSAARYGIAIEPLLSLSIDYYIRVFVRVRKSPAEVKFLAGKTMLVYGCDVGCKAYKPQFLARTQKKESKKGGQSVYKHSLAQGPSRDMLCEHCGSKSHTSGPMWGGPLHNQDFIEKVLATLPSLDKNIYGTTERIEGMLTTAYEEDLSDQPSVQAAPSPEPASTANPTEDTDELSKALIPSSNPAQIEHHPFYFMPSVLAKTLHCQAPSEAQLRGALRHAGYRATRSHAKAGSIRTDAPWSVLWAIMREWIRQKAPIKESALKPGSPGYRILGLGDQATTSGADEPNGRPAAAEGGLDERVGQPTLEVVFDEELGRDKVSKRLKRYQPNPRPNWGPMARAKFNAADSGPK